MKLAHPQQVPSKARCGPIRRAVAKSSDRMPHEYLLEQATNYGLVAGTLIGLGHFPAALQSERY
jgi:hypothetical protein